jgi:hypothetical protein
MRSLLRTLDGLFLLLSPIALLFFLLCALLLPVNVREHPLFLAQLEEEGQVTKATVTAVLDNGTVLIRYTTAAGAERTDSLATAYYDGSVRATLQPESVHTVRYLPTYGDNQSPILESEIDAVRSYRKPLGGLYALLIASWLVLIIRPDILYAGYVQNWTAVRDELPGEVRA